ncbi:MAG TPA: DUF6265 family protein [Gemmatimonadales bacterium]|nr:DUF6265 family protein [Gemmatimonadales bacterium]
MTPAALGWLAGDWLGSNGEDPVEEHWSPLRGNTLQGMFRWVKDGKVHFYELIAIEQEGEFVRMRIKHFHPGLVGWEEKDRAHEWVLVRLDGQEAVFFELDTPEARWAVYRLESRDRLVSYFMREDEPVTDTGMFEYTRCVGDSFAPGESRLIELWERHMRCEFTERDAAATVATMSRENYVNHVPVLTGGRGVEEMLEFYGRHFIPRMPADTRITPVCRTVGQGRVVDEIIFSFTHDTEMDWMLPGVPPTGRRVEVALVVVVQIAGDEIVCERIYWDQASVLVQIGLLQPSGLPVAGVESARKVLDPGLPSNGLIRRSTRAS